MKVTIAEREGVCRWCQCTDDDGCDRGCSWADRARTLCSECVSLDALIRTRAGRRELAILLQDYADEALLAVSALG